ncbi:50S ribosomal protein L21e [Candidatus Woesearchaeota archaeon]|nr:50S ribosomal protein L21e [Candidatus Woesearchaeota archaeon]
MVKRVGTSRRKTRKFYSVPKKMKGKLTVSSFVKKFNDGENVVLKAHPAILEGIYFRRFHGKMGKIVGKQGRCYKVQLTDGGKQKTLIVAAVHLKSANMVAPKTR